jgi:hypothetical protein
MALSGKCYEKEVLSTGIVKRAFQIERDECDSDSMGKKRDCSWQEKSQVKFSDSVLVPILELAPRKRARNERAIQRARTMMTINNQRTMPAAM